MLKKGSRKFTLHTHINFQRIIIILKEENTHEVTVNGKA